MKLNQPSNNQWFLITILALILIVNVTHSSNSFNQNKQNTAETLGVTDNALLRRSINQHGNYGQTKLSEDLNQTLTDVVDGLTDAIDIASQYNNVDFLEEAQQIMNRLKQHIMDNIMSLEQNQNKTTNTSDNARRGLTSYFSDYDIGTDPNVAPRTRVPAGKRVASTTINCAKYPDTTQIPYDKFGYCAEQFLQKIIDSGDCHQEFQTIIKDGKKACKVFKDKSHILCTNNQEYRIRPFIASQKWQTTKRCKKKKKENCCDKEKSVNAENCCANGKSVNAPVPIVITHVKDGKTRSFPYYLKKQVKWGPANDYLAMKVAKWLTGIFAKIYKSEPHKAPIIKVFDVVPSFKPKSQCDPKWTRDNVMNMYFFTMFETHFSGGWIKNVKKSERTRKWNEFKTSPYPYFAAFDPKKEEHKCECGEHLDKLLRSLRGAFIIQMLLGVKDRHAENVGITSDCVVMNIDYGHFLGGKTILYRHVSMYNDYLEAYLQTIQKENKMEDKFIHDLWIDLKKLRSYFTGTEFKFVDFKKLTENEKYSICNKFYEFKETQFTKAWEAEQWISMTTDGYKFYHKQTMESYMMYTLFGNEEKSQPKIKYETKAKLKKMIKEDKQAINFKMQEKHVFKDRTASEIYVKAKKNGYIIPKIAECPTQ